MKLCTEIPSLPFTHTLYFGPSSGATPLGSEGTCNRRRMANSLTLRQLVDESNVSLAVSAMAVMA